MPWFGYAYQILGTLYQAHFLYDYKHQYLIIEKGKIQKNILHSFKNKIELNEIDEIKSIKGNYILKSETRNLSIDPSLIDKQSLIKLFQIFKTSKFTFRKNHFIKYKSKLE
jgi:regulator of RNase E activity RraB